MAGLIPRQPAVVVSELPGSMYTVLGIGVTVTSRVSPFRSMVRSSGVPGLVRIGSCTAVQLSKAVRSRGFPSIARRVSPGRRPAAAAGLCRGRAQPSAPASHSRPLEVTGVLQSASVLAPAGRTQAGTVLIVVVTTLVPTAVSVIVK